MKRPFAVFGLTLFFVMTLVARLNSRTAAVAGLIGGAGLFLLFVCMRRSRRSGVLPTVFLSVAVGCLLLLLVSRYAVLPAKQTVGKNVRVTAVAQSYAETGSNPKRRYVTASIRSLGTRRVHGNVRLSLPAKKTKICTCTHEIAPGDVIQFVGTVYDIGSGNYDIQRSFYGKNIYLGAYPTKPVTRTSGRATVLSTLMHARRWISDRLKAHLSEGAAALAISVLLGDKHDLPDGVYDDFKDAGIAHIMAVSGLHLSVWTVLVMHLLSRRGKNKRTAAVISMAFVLAIMALALFSGSVLRAGLMLLVYLFGFLLRRTPDALNSLGFAASVILLVSPTMCMSVGFTLSVLSTLSILTLALPLLHPVEERLHRSFLLRPVKAALSAVLTTAVISVCVAVVTLPVQVDSFETVSLVSVLSNLMILPVVMPLLVCSGLFVALAAVPGVSTALHWMLEKLARYCFFVAHKCGRLPHAVLHVPNRLALLTLILSAILFLSGLLIVRRIQRRTRARFEIWADPNPDRLT